MKLLKKSIADLEPRKNKYYVMDDGLDGFGIKVYPSGKKSYIVRLRFKGSKKEYAISDVSVLVLSEAKDKARDIIKQYKQGIDVKANEQKHNKMQKTLDSCIEQYLPTVKATTQKDIIRCKNYWKNWLNRPIRDISKSMVLRSYDKRVKKSGIR